MVRAHCWDLETNTRRTDDFEVKHEIKAHGAIKKLTDPRDIRELTANLGARRERGCILSIIPGDILDEAVAQCKQTLLGNSTEPLIDRANNMVRAFSAFGVTQGMIEARLGHNLAAISPIELMQLRQVYTSLHDEAGSREDFFEVAPEDPAAELTPGKKRPAAKRTRKKKADAPAPEPPPSPEEPNVADMTSEEAAEAIGNQADTADPATTTDAHELAGEQAIQVVAFIARGKLKEAGLSMDEPTIRKLLQFAMLGDRVSDVLKPTKGQADEMIKRLGALSVAEIQEAMG